MRSLATISSTDLPAIEGPGLGPFGQNVLDGPKAAGGLTNIISSVIGVMTVAAAIWFFFQLLVGGLNWLTSGGDKKNLGEARDRITNAFIGLIIVVAAWAIVAVVGQFLGFTDILIPDPSKLIEKLKVTAPGLPQLPK